MIKLPEAIELVTKAHEGQWRNKIYIDYKHYTQLLDTYNGNLVDDGYYLLDNGNKLTKEVVGFSYQEPYITHPLAVMEMMDTEEEKIVAVLHDVIEDCKGYGLGRIADNSRFYIICKDSYGLRKEIDISFDIYSALTLLTHYKPVPYDHYIKTLVQGNVRYDISNKKAAKLATKVKLADIIHNMSDNPSDIQKEKYLKVIPVLLKSI